MTSSLRPLLVQALAHLRRRQEQERAKFKQEEGQNLDQHLILKLQIVEDLLKEQLPSEDRATTLAEIISTHESSRESMASHRHGTGQGATKE